jgi:hypothetical protein
MKFWALEEDEDLLAISAAITL